MNVMIRQIFCAIICIFGVVHAVTDQSVRQNFLHCHNLRRSQLALGKYLDQPPASDMTVMDYDTELEKRAILWNDQCIVGHDTSHHRKVQLESYNKSFHEIGQNWAGATRDLLKNSCEGWWNEHLNYIYATNSKKDPNQMIGHYTQMAWAETTLIGCAVADNCVGEKKYRHHAVCNYAAAGNYVGRKPYKNGTACSECPDGFTMCMHESLCARPDQCSRSNAHCKCALTCRNGGTLDETTCTCQCGINYFGDNCQNKCEDTNEYCGAEYDVDCNDTYWMKHCRKRCNNCVSDKPFVTNATAGVKIQIIADSSFTTEGRVGAFGRIQMYTVPSSGCYELTAKGAKGGDLVYRKKMYSGGLGALVKMRVCSLLTGQKLSIVVGQTTPKFQFNSTVQGPGGGGGSFVYDDTKSPPWLYLAAGGGGGGGNFLNDAYNNCGKYSENGQDSDDHNKTGGTNGSGGKLLIGCGAGWFSSGHFIPFNNYSGNSRKEGWLGGRGKKENLCGGFGGGGSGDFYYSGGGGGFSGGGGGHWHTMKNIIKKAGGGGSFCNSSLAVSCTKVSGGNMENDGLVTIIRIV